MNITVNVDDVTLSTSVAEIVEYDEDGDYVSSSGSRTVADIVAEKIMAALIKDERYSTLRKRALEIRDEVIREALAPVVEQALAEPFQRTNSYGEPSGSTVTMRTVIAEEAKKFMTQPADSYHRDNGTVLQVMVRNEVKAALGAEVEAAVKAARDEVAEQIGSTVATAVKTALKSR